MRAQLLIHARKGLNSLNCHDCAPYTVCMAALKVSYAKFASPLPLQHLSSPKNSGVAADRDTHKLLCTKQRCAYHRMTLATPLRPLRGFFASGAPLYSRLCLRIVAAKAMRMSASSTTCTKQQFYLASAMLPAVQRIDHPGQPANTTPA